MFFVFILLVQLVIAAVVVLVLKKNLDDILIESAIKQLELRRNKPSLLEEHDQAPPRGPTQSAQAITVLTHKNLDAENQKRIMDETLKQLGQTIKPSFQVDRTLLGGMIIKVGDNLIDCSLRERLHRAMTQR